MPITSAVCVSELDERFHSPRQLLKAAFLTSARAGTEQSALAPATGHPYYYEDAGGGRRRGPLLAERRTRWI